MNTYKIKQKYGIDDLKSLYAFHGNSQGDETRTNSIEDFNNSKGWLSFVFDCELTKEAIDLEIQKRIEWNTNYISELVRDDKYGKEYDISIHVIENPLFDDNEYSKKQPMESYKFLILDLNKNKL